ncbi:DgsA anti-repressor MtfA [Chimaeribacter californicus]|uniref:Mlc titration factor A n=1 Tax=Chimaeribacter californicus TaxID=2060067 RepID=A0A2N5EEG0_9GAMM|nr:DgsA anti-repressor MtfA [Chimaeribacter californicus]PLR40887.1 DgsA anti-repressor MtfA [Chimaeribacter californicus]
MIKWPWKATPPPSPPFEQWPEALAIPLFAAFTAEEKQQITALAAHFLRQKRLVPLQGLVLTPLMEARLGLLFALPVMSLGLPWLDGFHEVLIYPAPFLVEDVWEDDAGLVHSGPMVHAGQSWEQGPVVLNWQDVQDSFDLSGFNLVVHEVAHKLDLRNGGVVNGVPPIPLRSVAGWEQALHAAMDAIQEESDLVGEAAASLDAYAATDPAECFAVLSEYFFSAPELLAGRFPALYPYFVSFYRQDPLARLQRPPA